MSFLVRANGLHTSVRRRACQRITEITRLDATLAVRSKALRTPSRNASTEAKTSTTSTSFATLGSATTSGSSSNFRVRTVFLGLTALGLIVTGGGVYVYYSSFTTWPAEVRDDLRAAVKAEQQQDWRKATVKFRQALGTAKSLPAEKLGGKEALLRVSGINIALASVFEQMGDFADAYGTYADALDYVRANAVTPQDRLRAVTLAQRCGDLARIQEVVGDKAKAMQLAEDHLAWSVEELLRLSIPEETRQDVLEGKRDAIMLDDLPLPPWVSRTTLGASLESLGQLYAAQGKASHAVPLYVQAINLVMPPDKSKRTHDPTVAERCRAGILMNNVAQLMVDAVEREGQKQKLDEAQAWAIRGLDIVAFALRGTGWDMKGGQGFKNVEGKGDDDPRTQEVRGTCWMAEMALLMNLGELARMKKDDCKAREFFQQAYVRADKYGMREARSRCAQALSELERARPSKRK